MRGGLRGGLGIVVVAGEHARARARRSRRSRRAADGAVHIQDGDVHAGARKAAASDRHVVVVDAVQGGRQHGDVAGHLAHAEILHQHLAQLAQRVHLVGAIHRRAGIDHVAQRGMVVAIHRLMPRQHRQDGRHGEHVGHAMPLDQPPRLLAVQPLAGQQHAWRRRARPAAVRGCRRRATAAPPPARRRARWCPASGRTDGCRRRIPSARASARPPSAARWCRRCRRTTPDDRDRRRPARVDRVRRRRQRLPRRARRSPIEICSRARGIFRSRRGRMVRERGIEDMHRRRRRIARDRRPPAASGGNSSAPRPRRASRTRTSSRARRWSCARAAGSRSPCRTPRAASAPAARLHAVAELRPGPGACRARSIAGRSGNRRAVCEQQVREIGWSGSAQPAPGSTRSWPPPRRPC